MAAGSGSCLIPLSQQTRGGRQAEASAEGHFSFSSFCLPFLFGRLNISGAKQDGERWLLGGTALMSLRLNPGWMAVCSLIELAFSSLKGTVGFGACFHFTTKMSGFFFLSL